MDPVAKTGAATAATSTEVPAALPQLLLARAAALLMLISLLTGGYVAAAMTGKIDADAHTTLAAHLGAMFGSFWMLGIAWTLPMLRYRPSTQRWLAWAFIVVTYSNWFVTALKALFHVAGIDAGGSTANSLTFVVLNVLVVVPSLVATAAWAFGFKKLSELER